MLTTLISPVAWAACDRTLAFHQWNKHFFGWSWQLWDHCFKPMNARCLYARWWLITFMLKKIVDLYLLKDKPNQASNWLRHSIIAWRSFSAARVVRLSTNIRSDTVGLPLATWIPFNSPFLLLVYQQSWQGISYQDE